MRNLATPDGPRHTLPRHLCSRLSWLARCRTVVFNLSLTLMWCLGAPGAGNGAARVKSSPHRLCVRVRLLFTWVSVRLYQAPSMMRVALQCVLAALGLASMSLQVSAWGPITHYRMTCGGVQPSTSVAACASSPANADLIVGSDLPDAFYFVRHQDVRCGTCGGPVSSRGRGRCLTFGCWCARESSSRDLAAPDHGHCTISVRHHHGCCTVTGHDLHCLVQSTLGTR